MPLPQNHPSYQRWKALSETIQASTAAATGETRAQQLRRIAKARRDYNFFVQYYFPHYCTDKLTGDTIPCAPFHIKAAKYILEHRDAMAVFMWPRGHAKSTHMGVFVPLWLHCQAEPTIHTMVLAGKSYDSACQLLGDLQAELQYNQRYAQDFGQQYNAGNWADGEFATLDGTAFHAIGRGQSPRGLRDRQHRPDYIICDDLDDDELSRNPDRVRQATEWTTQALMGTFGAEGGRFMMVGNLISKCSILANICETPGLYLSRVDAFDKKGNPSWPQYWTRERLDARRAKVGFLAFEKEYMNNPITLGAVFRQEWLQWGPMLPLRQYRQLVCYTDPSWKASKNNDFKATMLLGLTPSGHYHLLRAYADQTTVTNMIAWLYAVQEYVDGRVPVHYYMEANMLQQIIVDQVRQHGEEIGKVIPLRGDSRKKPDKFARIEALQPLFEQGLILFNEAEKDSPGMQQLVSQLLAFERGSRQHDDAPDALEGAIWLLNHRWNRTPESIPQPMPDNRHRRAW